MTLGNAIPICSLVVAMLAVFFGPLISWKVAKRQIDSSQRVAAKQIVAPMRQAWINALRDKISAICAEAEYLCYTGSLGQEIPDYTKRAIRLGRLEKEIALTLNPLEEDHIELAKRMNRMLYFLRINNANEFTKALNETMVLTQKILKIEWNRVKDGV